MRYVEYEVVSVNGIMLKKSFMTLGKDHIRINVKIEGEKHSYIIPAKHLLLSTG